MKNIDKKEIIDLLYKPGSGPMKIGELRSVLDIPKEKNSEFRKILGSLVNDGVIKRLKGGRYVSSGKKEQQKGKTEKKGDSKQTLPAKKSRIVGKLLKRRKECTVIPKDNDLPKITIDPSEGKGFKNNSLVVTEITGKKEKSNTVFGRILTVLGKAGDIEAERTAILYEYNLPLQFPKKVTRYADKIAKEDFQKEVSRRKDLRKNLTVTIDGDDAKDFDDAVGIARTRKGYKLWISIADVSYYVRRNSPLDKEASKRGNSYYLPGRVIPMLPEVLSNNLCSLVPGEDRLTKTVEIDFSKSGERQNYRIYDSVIKSDARLTYTWVSGVIEGKESAGKGNKQIVKSLNIMMELYEKLKKNRTDNGELEFDIPDAELVRNNKGEIVNVVKAERQVAHGIIEEFMIAANNAVGEYLSRKTDAAIYRIHERPDQMSMIELRDALQPIGYDFSFGKEVSPKDVQKVIFDARNRKDKSVVNMLILRSMKRAVYSTRDDIHFGLALENYTHFTSPIRRYPDLIVHRTIDNMNGKSSDSYDVNTLDRIAEHCSVTERRSDEVEREAVDLERANLMKDRVGEVFDGKIISIMPFGMFIELDGIFVEGFIPKSDMRAKRRKRWFRIGDIVKVKVTEADIERRRITLTFP